MKSNSQTLEPLGDCVTVLGLDGNIVYMSPSWLKQKGIPAEEVIGRRALTLFAPKSLENAPVML